MLYKYYLPGKYKYSYLMLVAFYYNSLKIVVIKQHYVKLMVFSPCQDNGSFL